MPSNITPLATVRSETNPGTSCAMVRTLITELVQSGKAPPAAILLADQLDEMVMESCPRALAAAHAQLPRGRDPWAAI